MNSPDTPELDAELARRIKVVRRDMGNLLFHFTRKPDSEVKIKTPYSVRTREASASAVLEKILHEGHLKGSLKWSNGEHCVCFTDAPIQEFNAIFALNSIASDQRHRPRYEPYGIAVRKDWLFSRGGRPVIYDKPDAFENLPEAERYRHVSYDPLANIDYTWEREWRIKGELLELDPNQTLVVVPTSEEAFQIVYDFAKIETSYDDEGPNGTYHEPRWLAVSLEMFGFHNG